MEAFDQKLTSLWPEDNIAYGYSCKCYSCPSLTVDILLDMTSRTDTALYLENSLLTHVVNRSSWGVHDGYLVSLFRPMSSSSAQDNSPAPPMSAQPKLQSFNLSDLRKEQQIVAILFMVLEL